MWHGLLNAGKLMFLSLEPFVFDRTYWGRFLKEAGDVNSQEIASSRHVLKYRRIKIHYL